MDSYEDRISKFNDMVNTTNDHINAIREATSRLKSDPIGTALQLTGEVAGGSSSIAGTISGINHFKDYKKMYSGLKNVLSNKLSGETTTNNKGNTSNIEESEGSNASNEQAPKVKSQTAENFDDVDAGIQDRINNIGDSPNIINEANSISKAINNKVNQTLGSDGKQILNDASRSVGRTTAETKNLSSQVGEVQVDSAKDVLNFKNNVANDSIKRFNTGRPKASGYDRDGKSLGDAEVENPSVVNQTPSNNVNPVVPENNVDLINNADEDASGIIARGEALGLQTGNIPNSIGNTIEGLRTGMGDTISQNANIGSRIQQEVGNQVEHQTSALRNPNGIEMQDMASNGETGLENGSTSLNPSQGSTTASNIADEISNVGSKVGSGVSEATEGVASAIGEGLEGASAFSGPIAPLVGLVGGLVSLGTTIASQFHKKPQAVLKPVVQQNIGGNLSNNLSSTSGGIV